MRKNNFILGMTLFFTLALFSLGFCEDITITTYYPSPYGSYNELTTTGNTYLATDSTGKVGIGTTNPIYKLGIEDNNIFGTLIDLKNTGLGQQSGIRFLDAANNPFATILANAVASPTRFFSINAFGGNRLVIDDQGNVGIGTVSPGSKLAVSGNAVIGSGYATSAGPTDGLVIQGKVGIGTTAPASLLHVIGSSGLASIRGETTSSVRAGIRGETTGFAGATCYGSLGGNLTGVLGYTNPGGWSSGFAVRGEAQGSAWAGYFAGGAGVYASGGNNGVYAQGGDTGVYGTGGNYGVHGSGYYGVYGTGTFAGYFDGPVVINGTLSAGNTALNSTSIGTLSAGSATIGSATIGNLNVTGSLTKPAGSFLIDHPLDPKNKVLRHSFVESPDMKNIYDGIIVLDEDGQASVELPNYFIALNKDYRYQLTPIGAYAGVYIKQEIRENKFVIAGGYKGLKVSWQVTGIRKDAFAQKHPIVVEEIKGANNNFKKGEYLYPQVF